MKTPEAYHFSEIPLTPVDLVNRRAAATGSPRYAQLAEHGDYNGHYVTVSFKPHAIAGPTWNAEYWWAGRVVLARGSLEQCVRAAAYEYRRGARGTHVVVGLAPEAPEPLEEQAAICIAAGMEPMPPAPRMDTKTGRYDRPRPKPHYWTGTHEAVSDACTWAHHGFADMVPFALAWKGEPEDWPTARDAWLEERRRARATGGAA